METGSLADWVSGIGSMLAVIVALAGYWISHAHRKEDHRIAEEARKFQETASRQGIVHQISLKLSALASEATTTHVELIPPGRTEDELAKMLDPRQITGEFNPNVGMELTMARDLAVDEQNLLMLVKENDFLMDYSEALARHESVRAGILEYKAKREAVMAMLPAPKIVNGQMASHFLSDAEWLTLAPYVIPLRSLLVSIRALSRQNVELLARLCASYKPMMAKHFPQLNIHSIELGEAEQFLQSKARHTQSPSPQPPTE